MNVSLNSVWARLCCLLLLLFSPCSTVAFGQDDSGPVESNTDIRQGEEAAGTTTVGEADVDDILDLDIEQLGKVDVVVPSFDIEVTSVTKSKSTVGKSPAAVYVITQEMIRRSAATSIPRLLRMVPGLQVARIDANKWAISSRGFNGRFANKLLVMIDGRSVYSPVFSGVYWDIQDTVLQDIERIEVIRGPGATVWGANAVNGVINIITKNAKETQGALIASGGGSEDKTINSVRYGGQSGSNLHYRIYGKQFERDTGTNPGGAHDDWRQKRVGMRADWNPDDSERDLVTFQGDYYEGTAGSTYVFPTLMPPSNTSAVHDDRVAGGNFMTRWTRQLDDESSFSLQGYYDRRERIDLFQNRVVDILDVDFTHRLRPARDHGVTWGMRYRYISSDQSFTNPFVINFIPAERQTNQYSAFLQDEISLVDDVLSLTLGSKFMHNDFTGFEYQPGSRLLWAIDKKRVAWASVSRAVRTPSRADDDLRLVFANIAPAPPTFLGLRGNRNFESEDLLAFEIGYREQPKEEFSWDVSLFYNDYNDLFASSAGSVVFQPPAFLLLQDSINGMDGETYGVELSANYKINPNWNLHGSYTFLQMQLHAGSNTSSTAESAEGESPQNQVYVQSSWNLTESLEFDLIGRYVDSLPTININHYTTLDLRLAWRPNKNWEFAVLGRNLLEEHHREFAGTDTLSTEVDRGVFAQAIWRH